MGWAFDQEILHDTRHVNLSVKSIQNCEALFAVGGNLSNLKSNDPQCGTIANCIAAYYCLNVNCNGADFWDRRDLQLLATTVDGFLVLD